MKRLEFQKCALCKQGVAHNNQLIFWVLNVQQFCLIPSAIQRRAGMEEMMGGGYGGAALAQIMGTDDDLAKVVNEKKLFLCSDCALENGRVITEATLQEDKRANV